MVLISVMDAPQANSCAVISCSSSKGINGFSKREDPPPDRRKRTVSRSSNPVTIRRIACVPRSATLVRDRMTGLIANDIFNRPLYMTVFRKHNACTHLFVKALNGTIRHFPCRFANSNKVKPALGEFAILKCCGHCRAGHNSLNGFAHDALSFIAHSHCSHLFTTWIGALEIKC